MSGQVSGPLAILSQIYSEVLTLEAFLLNCKVDTSQLGEGLSCFLKKTLVCSNGTQNESRIKGVSYKRKYNLEELLCEICVKLKNSVDGHKNSLLISQRRQIQDYEYWSQTLDLCGPNVIVDIFGNRTVFMANGEGSYVQLTGYAAYEKVNTMDLCKTGHKYSQVKSASNRSGGMNEVSKVWRDCKKKAVLRRESHHRKIVKRKNRKLKKSGTVVSSIGQRKGRISQDSDTHGGSISRKKGKKSDNSEIIDKGCDKALADGSINVSKKQGISSAFNPHLTLGRRVILYGKSLKEQCNFQDSLSKTSQKSLHRHTDGLMRHIFMELNVEQNSDEKSSGYLQTDNLTMGNLLDSDAAELFRSILKNIHKVPWKNTVERYCPIMKRRLCKRKHDQPTTGVQFPLQTNFTETQVCTGAAQQAVSQVDETENETAGDEDIEGPACKRRKIIASSEEVIHGNSVNSEISARTLEDCSKQPLISASVAANEPRQSHESDHVNTCHTNANSSVALKSLSVKSLLSKHTSNKQLFLLLRAILLKVIPSKLWGSKHNFRVVLDNVKLLLRLGKNEDLTLGCLMRRMRVSDCAWLECVKDMIRREKLLAKFLYWVFISIIFPTLRGYFYVTDTTTCRNKVLYFRKSLWKVIEEKSMVDLHSQGCFTRISESEALDHVRNKKCLGVGRSRLSPKAESLRPICMLGAKSKHGPPVNRQLDKVFALFDFIRKAEPSIMGSATFSADEMYMHWKRFLARRNELCDDRPLYFIKVDLKGCFDLIEQEQLLAIVKSVFDRCDQHGTLVLQRYATLQKARRGVTRRFHSCAVPRSQRDREFYECVQCLGKKHFNCILVEQSGSQLITFTDCFSKLKAIICHNICMLRETYFKQSRGIPQGCRVSTFLCGLYLAEAEKQFITTRRDELLLRSVDDFLFVTPIRGNIEVFFNGLVLASQHFGFVLRRDKCLVNYASPLGLPLTDGLLTWCGFSFDTRTLQVIFNSTSYAGHSVTDMISVHRGECRGDRMKERLVFPLRHQLHVILFCDEINNEETIVMNVFNLCVLTAFKFRAYAMQLPDKISCQESNPFFLDVIHFLASYVTRKVRRMPTKTKMNGAFIHWLCARAFICKLKLHNAYFNELVRSLKMLTNRLELLMNFDERRLCAWRAKTDALPCSFNTLLDQDTL